MTWWPAASPAAWRRQRWQIAISAGCTIRERNWRWRSKTKKRQCDTKLIGRSEDERLVFDLCWHPVLMRVSSNAPWAQRSAVDGATLIASKLPTWAGVTPALG